MNAVFILIINDHCKQEVKEVWNQCVEITKLRERALIKTIEFKGLPSIHTLTQKLGGLQKYVKQYPSLFLLSGKAYDDAMANDKPPEHDQIEYYNGIWSYRHGDFIPLQCELFTTGILYWIKHVEVAHPNWFEPKKVLPFKQQELQEVASVFTLSPFWASAYTNKSGFKIQDPKIIGSTYLDTLKDRRYKIHNLVSSDLAQTCIIEELHYLGLMDYFFLNRDISYYQKLICYHLDLLISIHIL